ELQGQQDTAPPRTSIPVSGSFMRYFTKYFRWSFSFTSSVHGSPAVSLEVSFSAGSLRSCAASTLARPKEAARNPRLLDFDEAMENLRSLIVASEFITPSELHFVSLVSLRLASRVTEKIPPTPASRREWTPLPRRRVRRIVAVASGSTSPTTTA